MNTYDAADILDHMAGIWGKPNDDRLKAYRDWLDRTDASKGEVMHALTLLENTEEFWPKPVKLRTALQEVGALGAAQPGTRHPVLIGAHMKAIEELCTNLLPIRRCSKHDLVQAHLADIRDQYEEMVRCDLGDKGWFIDRIAACEQMLQRGVA